MSQDRSLTLNHPRHRPTPSDNYSPLSYSDMNSSHIIQSTQAVTGTEEEGTEEERTEEVGQGLTLHLVQR